MNLLMPSRSYSSRVAVALALALLGMACSGDNRPAGPTAPINPPTVSATPPLPPQAPPPGPPEAVLTIVEFRLDGYGGVRLVLAETGGRSGATFDAPYLILANGNTDYGCGGWQYVRAGGRWDMTSLSYCAPDGDGTNRSRVVVHFFDDQGRPGTLTGAMTGVQ